ncbi:MAG: DNA replication/repair protein RecF [Pseudomonadota bacterium]
MERCWVVSLFVSSLTMRQMRSHQALSLEVGPTPVVVHGPNGAGKTNILEAVSLLSPGRGLRRAKAEEIARRPEVIGWKLGAELASRGEVVEVETAWAPGQSGRSVEIDGKTAPQSALGRYASVVWLVPAMDRLWIEGADGRRRFLDRMALSFRSGHGEVVLAYEKAMRERNRLLKDQIRDPSWYRTLEAQMAQAGEQITENRAHCLAELNCAQEGAETSFPVAELSLDVGYDGELAEVLSAGRTSDMAAGRTLQGPHRAEMGALYAAKGVVARDCSTGEQKALLVSLILANGRALARDFAATPLILLDEVAAHLDQVRQAALYDEICALGAQAWMTGTGPEHFTALGRRAQYLNVTDRDGVSVVEGP